MSESQPDGAGLERVAFLCPAQQSCAVSVRQHSGATSSWIPFNLDVRSAELVPEDEIWVPGKIRDTALWQGSLLLVSAAGIGVLDPLTLEWIGYEVGSGLAAARSVTGCGSFICVSRLGLFGLKVLDLSDPSAPQMVGSQVTFGLGWDIASKGSRVYVAHGLLGVGVYDIDRTGAPSYHDTLWPGGIIRSVALRNGLLAVARKGGLVKLYDVTGAPLLVGSFQAQGNVSRVRFVAGQLWVLSKQGDRVEVWALPDPAAPELMGEFDQASAALFRARWVGTQVLTFDGPRLQVLRARDVSP